MCQFLFAKTGGTWCSEHRRQKHFMMLQPVRLLLGTIVILRFPPLVRVRDLPLMCSPIDISGI
jgi:hypothetical protein